MSDDPNIVIMAAGASSRMRRSLEDSTDISSDIPKAMIPVGPNGRPFLDYLLLNAARGGYSVVVIVVSESGEIIQQRDADPSEIWASIGPEAWQHLFGFYVCLILRLTHYQIVS